uniref:Uncharacterized protein n=1 Tax=Caenorhabditis japonica TaxID=281687 RepID=A0A8R1ER40_CAEJA
MALIRGRQINLAKQFKTSKSVIWATLNTPNRSKATGRPLKTSSGDGRIIVRMSRKNPRLTSTDIKYQVPTVKHGGGNVMMWGCFHANGVGSLIRITGTIESYMYKDILEKKMNTIWKISDGSWVVVQTGQRSETLFPLFQRLVRTASSERYDPAKPISRPEFLRASLGGSL